MTARTPFRSPFSILALAGIAAVAIAFSSWGSHRDGSSPPLPPGCEGLTPEECAARTGDASRQAGATVEEPVLAMGEVCIDVGYLCADVVSEGSLRLLRWPLETAQVRIRIPEPPHVPPAVARDFQRAAVRGVQSWNGHPIPLSIRTRTSGEPPDITIEWAEGLEEGRLGRAQLEWTRRGQEVVLRVVGFTVATHHPGDPHQQLTPEQVELIAAHEMGHALGLPHSDDPRDVMFPQNTATRLTARDFRTLEALYALPNGAEIRR